MIGNGTTADADERGGHDQGKDDHGANRADRLRANARAERHRRPPELTLRATVTPSSRPVEMTASCAFTRAEHDRPILVRRTAANADEPALAVVADGVARYHQGTRHAGKLDVQRCRQIRHQVRVRSLDIDQGHEGPDLADRVERTPSGEICATRPLNDEVWIRVQPNANGLPDFELVDVRLIDLGADPHQRRVDDVDDRHPAPDFLAFLDLGHRSALPDRAHDSHAADRRENRHLVGVALGLLHGVLGAIAANLQDAHVGLRGLALQIERGLELREPGVRFLERLLVLLRLDFRQELVLDDLELRPAAAALRLFQLALVFRARGALLGVLLPNLLLEIAQLDAAIERVLQLVLAIELDEQVAGLHECAGA